ncbi:box C/D snoRNA protein 1-like isoform X1 [Montipora foliosa]|uniref:box C/D snoRNA protein 1-like isoform X1 n=1 Tax=Montipora foliosa TaxID=591990 RepID=UPI0035F2010B
MTWGRKETKMADNVANGSCLVCGKINPKYRCPGCERQTCSLACVKGHKRQFLCSGVRCKTKFISVAKYTDSDLLSDYRFLEDVDRLAYTVAHDSRKSWKRWGNQASLLRWKAKERGVDLRLMPPGMSKRKENSSKFNKTEQCILWRIHWLFPQAGMEYIDKWVSEHSVLCDVLKKYIDPEEADPVYKQSLKNYIAIGLQGVSVFLRVEPLPASKLRYYELDTSKTIKDCLANKLIVEFPTLHVVLPNNVASYPTSDQSEANTGDVESVDAEKKAFCELPSSSSEPPDQTLTYTHTGDEESVNTEKKAVCEVQSSSSTPQDHTETCMHTGDEESVNAEKKSFL